MKILVVLFYLFFIMSIYSYFIYPLILSMLPRRKKEYAGNAGSYEQKKVAMIIAAHNEEDNIKKKIENTLAIDYSQDKFEIIVASDHSTDNTNQIVKSYAMDGVKLVEVTEHKGKEFAQWCALQETNAEIIIFSDVGTMIPRDAVRMLVMEFEDKTVGAVSSEDRFISRDGKLVGEGAYIKYEMWLRRIESERAGLVGLSGSFFAARRVVTERWDSHVCSDFNIARNCARMGLVAITSPNVLGFYQDVSDPKAEYARKKRTVLRGISAIPRHSWVLNPFRMGVYAFEVWSHKIMRWAVPWFLLMLFITSIFLQGYGLIYSVALVMQIVIYTIAFTGWIFDAAQEKAVVRIIYYFFHTNIAIAHATIDYLLGRRVLVWTPTRR